MTLALSLFATVLTGGRRFAHVERLREDEVVKRFIGAARLPSAMTLTRYFGGFVRSQVEQLSAVLAEHTRVRLARLPGDVLDLDSTVFERYGRQQGRLKGHNPSKHGRPSHHPLLAMLARSKLVLHSWLRSGNSGSARGVSGFLAEVTRDPAPQLARLRTEHLVAGAIVGRDGREVVLRLGLRGRYRERFVALLERIDASTRPTVMQSRNALEPLAFTASRPWQPRPARRSSAPRAPLI